MRLERAKWDTGCVCGGDGTPWFAALRLEGEGELAAKQRRSILLSLPVYGVANVDSLNVSIHPFYLVRGDLS